MLHALADQKCGQWRRKKCAHWYTDWNNTTGISSKTISISSHEYKECSQNMERSKCPPILCNNVARVETGQSSSAFSILWLDVTLHSTHIITREFSMKCFSLVKCRYKGCSIKTENHFEKNLYFQNYSVFTTSPLEVFTIEYYTFHPTSSRFIKYILKSVLH